VNVRRQFCYFVGIFRLIHFTLKRKTVKNVI